MNAIDRRLVFYQGQHVILKVLTERDVRDSPWVGWFNDDELCEHNLHHFFPNTFERQLEHWKNAVGDRKIQLGVVAPHLDDELCGVISLQDIDWIHRRADLAVLLDHRRTRQHPWVFIEAWSLMLTHAFRALNLHKVCAGTFNPFVAPPLRSIFNFEVEAVLKKHVWKSGSFHDITLLGVLSTTVRYPSIPPGGGTAAHE